MEPASLSDIVCDVIPYSTTNGVWDDKSLYVASCRRVTMGSCVTELGTRYSSVQVTDTMSACWLFIASLCAGDTVYVGLTWGDGADSAGDAACDSVTACR